MGLRHPGVLLKSPEDSEKLAPCPLGARRQLTLRRGRREALGVRVRDGDLREEWCDLGHVTSPSWTPVAHLYKDKSGLRTAEVPFKSTGSGDRLRFA